jgi:hypothetical protein
MTKKLIFFLFLFLALLSGKSFGALLDYNIYFINGMDNEPEEADKSRKALRTLVLPDVPDSSVKPLYQRNTGSQRTMLGRVKQMAIAENSRETFKRYWKCYTALSPNACTSSDPNAADMYQMIFDVLGSYSETAYVQNTQLQSMVSEVANSYNNGKKSLLVAHSQGNFYANQVVNFLQAAAPDIAACTDIVGVASPATYVAKDGPYKTRHDDLVISSSRGYLPGPILPSNVNGVTTPDLSGHKFIESYITPSTVRSLIRADIVAQTTTEFDGPCKLDPHCTQLNTTQVFVYGATVQGVRHKLGTGPKRTVKVRVDHNFIYSGSWGMYGYIDIYAVTPTGLFSLFAKGENYPDTYRYSFEFDSAALNAEEVIVYLSPASNTPYYNDPKPVFSSTACIDCGNAVTACP